jgi:hypothetical protein
LFHLSRKTHRNSAPLFHSNSALGPPTLETCIFMALKTLMKKPITDHDILAEFV